MGSRLAALLDQATPGPWKALHDNGTVWAHGYCIAADEFHNAKDGDARLIALAPDMARLLVNMAEALDYGYFDRTTDTWRCAMCEAPAGHADGCSHGELLARFAALDEKAGGA